MPTKISGHKGKVSTMGDIKVFVDGHELQGFTEADMSYETTEEGPFMNSTTLYYSRRSPMAIRVKSWCIDVHDGIEHSEVIERNGIKEFHIFGPLRKAFPSLFTQRELLPWQSAFLRAREEYRKSDEYTIFNDDILFETYAAKRFKKGYDKYDKHI